MKRCGKSAPRWQQCRWHGKPRPEQDRIGSALIGFAYHGALSRWIGRVGRLRPCASKAPEEWLYILLWPMAKTQEDRTRLIDRLTLRFIPKFLYTVGMTIEIPDCLAAAPKVKLCTDMKVFEAGQRCDHFYYLLTGRVRVSLLTRAGKSITLYRFGRGETCILSTSCLFSGDAYNADAIVEEAIEAVAVPIAQFQSLLSTSESFRTLVFSSFASRLSAMMAKIEEVTSVSIDQRLALCALELANEEGVVSATHDHIAADLGTAREVVSRKLANWEGLGLIERSRGSFVILNKNALVGMAIDRS